MIMVYDLSPRPQNTSQIDLCSTELNPPNPFLERGHFQAIGVMSDQVKLAKNRMCNLEYY